MTYKKPFYLEKNCGNNAFAFDERGKHSRLYVPVLIEGGFEDLQVGNEVGFEDFDESGNLISAKGLKNFVKMRWLGVPTVIMDNHNHALYFWYEALAKGLLDAGAILVHVDQHKDMRRPDELLKSRNLEAVFKYTNETVNVGNYIVPAVEDGLISEILLVTGEDALESKEFMSKDNKILNIDLDFFAPELDYISFAKTKAFLLKHIKTASLITIASSPFFIDQKRAIEVMGALLSNGDEA